MTGLQKGARSRPLPDVDSAHSAREKSLWRWLRGSLIQAGRARVIIYLCCVSQPRAATFTRQPPTHRVMDEWGLQLRWLRTLSTSTATDSDFS